MTTSADSLDREALRQQLLVRALWRGTSDNTLVHWLRDGPLEQANGLHAYRGNGLALAERALASAHPTLVALLGPESFAALARTFWRQHAPDDGDIACFGAGLAAFIDGDALLASEPYLADVARLEWAVHRCAFAADAPNQVTGLERLGADDAPACGLLLRPGTTLCRSTWPVRSIWQAHQRTDGGRFDAVALAIARHQGEAALVVRDGWRVRVDGLEQGEAGLTAAVLRGHSLSLALTEAGDGFDFQAWLVRAVQLQWLVEVRPAAAVQA